MNGITLHTNARMRLLKRKRPFSFIKFRGFDDESNNSVGRALVTQVKS